HLLSPVAVCLRQVFPITLTDWISPMESWALSSACCTWRMECICISPNSAGMKREPRTIPPARSRYPRERAAGDYVDARRYAGALVYGNARCVEHDGWKFDDAHSHAAGGGVRFDNEILSQQSAAYDVLVNCRRSKSFHELHQSAGT